MGDIGTSYINTFVHRIPLFSHQKTSTRKLLGTETFTHRKLLHTNASTDKDIYTHKGSHTPALFVHRNFHTKNMTHNSLLHTQRDCYTRNIFHANVSSHTDLYAQTSLETFGAFGATTPLRSAGHASMCWELGAVEVANGYHHGYKML